MFQTTDGILRLNINISRIGGHFVSCGKLCSIISANPGRLCILIWKNRQIGTSDELPIPEYRLDENKRWQIPRIVFSYE